MNIARLLASAADRLAATSSTPRLDAELLLAHVLQWSRARVLAERSFVPQPAQFLAFEELLARRMQLEPVAYLLGQRAFYGLEFLVDRRVLVPRPETELLVELAIAEAAYLRTERPQPLVIADIGTGSGAIAVALATHLPDAQIYAVDLSSAALEVAQLNLQRHNVAERVTLLHGDLTAPLPEAVDLLVSNPPYTIIAEVEPNVRAHEPWLALEGGPDGAAIYRRLISSMNAALQPHASVLLEIGAWQAEVVSGLMQATLPAARIDIYQDLAGHDRVLRARRSRH